MLFHFLFWLVYLSFSALLRTVGLLKGSVNFINIFYELYTTVFVGTDNNEKCYFKFYFWGGSQFHETLSGAVGRVTGLRKFSFALLSNSTILFTLNQLAIKLHSKRFTSNGKMRYGVVKPDVILKYSKNL